MQADVQVRVGRQTFTCHRFAMCMFMDFFKFDIKPVLMEIDLSDLPGGAAAFRVIRDFCHGQPVTITRGNVQSLLAATRHLEMNNEAGRGSTKNLLEHCQQFLEQEELGCWRTLLGKLRGHPTREQQARLTVALSRAVSGFSTDDFAYFLSELLKKGLQALVKDMPLDIAGIGRRLLPAFEQAFIYGIRKNPSAKRERLVQLVHLLYKMLLEQNCLEGLEEEELMQARSGKVPLFSILAFVCSYIRLVPADCQVLLDVYFRFLSLLTINDLVELQPAALLLLLRPLRGSSHPVPKALQVKFGQLAAMIPPSLATKIRRQVPGLLKTDEQTAKGYRQMNGSQRRKRTRKQPQIIELSSSSSNC